MRGESELDKWIMLMSFKLKNIHRYINFMNSYRLNFHFLDSNIYSKDLAIVTSEISYNILEYMRISFNYRNQDSYLIYRSFDIKMMTIDNSDNKRYFSFSPYLRTDISLGLEALGYLFAKII